MNKYKFLVLYIVLCSNISMVKAQGIWGRLKQKAEQIGERVIDKTVDDVLDGGKRSGRKAKREQRESAPPDIIIEELPGKPTNDPAQGKNDENVALSKMILTDTVFNGIDTVYRFNTASISASEFVSYAITLKGTPYSYGSADPSYGLDCSGFITHVFNHFNIQVPRRTFDFKNAEKKVKVSEAKPGDLILFAGSDIERRTPGHMGIIISRSGKETEFIHASSGVSSGVTTSRLSNTYFKNRLLEVVRVF